MVNLQMRKFKKCEKDEKRDLQIKHSEIPMPQTKTKGAKYTPYLKELTNLMEFTG